LTRSAARDITAVEASDDFRNFHLNYLYYAIEICILFGLPIMSKALYFRAALYSAGTSDLIRSSTKILKHLPIPTYHNFTQENLASTSTAVTVD